MAQEDKGLVLRGMILLTGITVLVGIVLGVMFWRTPGPQPTVKVPPEHRIPSVVLLTVGSFPANVSWGSIWELGQTMPSAPGWEVRYNAATTLARRGSKEMPWDLLREMLDEDQQMRNYRVRQADGRDVYDEAAARANMVSALRALAAWHEKRKDDPKHDVPGDLREIYAMVDKLTTSDFVELKTQADKARATFFR